MLPDDVSELLLLFCVGAEALERAGGTFEVTVGLGDLLAPSRARTGVDPSQLVLIWTLSRSVLGSKLDDLSIFGAGHSQQCPFHYFLRFCDVFQQRFLGRLAVF